MAAAKRQPEAECMNGKTGAAKISITGDGREASSDTSLRISSSDQQTSTTITTQPDNCSERTRRLPSVASLIGLRYYNSPSMPLLIGTNNNNNGFRMRRKFASGDQWPVAIFHPILLTSCVLLVIFTSFCSTTTTSSPSSQAQAPNSAASVFAQKQTLATTLTVLTETRATTPPNSNTNLAILKVGHHLAPTPSLYEFGSGKQKLTGRLVSTGLGETSQQDFGPLSGASGGAGGKLDELDSHDRSPYDYREIDHQADNQSANQSNSDTRSSRAGGGGGAYAIVDIAQAGTDRVAGGNGSANARAAPTLGSLPPLNPNKCNLSKFWRPELCARGPEQAISLPPGPRRARHGNEVSRLQQHQQGQGRDESLKLKRVERSPVSQPQPPIDQIPGASGENADSGSNNNDIDDYEEDERTTRLVEPQMDLDRGSRNAKLVGELGESDEFEAIDPSPRRPQGGERNALGDKFAYLDQTPANKQESLSNLAAIKVGGHDEAIVDNDWHYTANSNPKQHHHSRRHESSPLIRHPQQEQQQQQQQQQTIVGSGIDYDGMGEEAEADDSLDWYHHDLIELLDDELFLESDSVRAASSVAAGNFGLASAKVNSRVRRGRGSFASKLGDVQTIYFGGFFPWLTDDEQVNNRANHRLASSLSAHNGGRTKISSSMIGHANQQQDVEHQHQQKQAKKKQNGSISKTDRRRQRKQQDNNTNNNLQQYENTTMTTTTPLMTTPYTGNSSGVAAAAAAAAAAAVAVVGATQASNNNNNGYSSEERHQLGKFILPAVRLALDHINTNRSVLEAYKLEIVPRDTQCNATISLKEFFDMVYEEPKKMLLYGDACRVSTDPIAKASYFFDLIQISYADTDPIYTIENYPNFFRVVPSENALSLARIPFIRHFNWTRVGTIYQNLPRYSLPHSKLLTDLERFDIVIKQSVSLPGSVDALQNRDLGDELRKLKEKDVRIILGNFDEEWGLLLFCEAFREKMTGRKYQWILTGMSEDRLWQYYKAKGSSCSEQELLIAMDGYIVTDITPVTRSQHPTISGMMAHEYSNEYKRRALEMNISIEENKFYGYVYDGIWAIALALHFVDKQLKYYSQLAETGKVQLKSEMQGLNSLLDFDYHKPVWVKLIRAALNRTRFDGVTGTVTFHKNERPGLISFSQFQAFRDMSEVIIGSYDALNDNLDLKVGFPIFWRGPSPPIDYTIERVTPFRINRTLFVIISILALFGIVLAFVFLTINIKFRDQRYIKMSSPYLNNLIIIGCILTYTSVIILGLDSGLTSEYNFPYICNARAWVLMAGFTLAFGSMFSKTFRVHSIFTNIKLHKKVIKDYKLFMVVFILLTFDVCILIVWQYFDPFYRDTNNGTSIQDSDNEDVIIVPEMEHCQSKRMTIFLSVIYVYKGLLMAFGCFLAWETRHVSIPALNDSKYIGLSVYNVVIMCVIGAGLSFVLRDQQDASFVIISIFIIFCSTTTLCLVFVPKLIELKQNPRASDHRVRATLKTFKKNYHEEAMVAAGCRDIHGNLIGRGYGVNLNERIKVLVEENVKQRTSLKEKTYELEALTYKYRKIQSMVQSGQYHQAINSTMAAANSGSNLAPITSSSVNSSALPTTIMLTTQELDGDHGSSSNSKDDGNLHDPVHHHHHNGDKLDGLTKPGFMSSTTQITTANTTSSTNNTTDLTTDYSSAKLTSVTATNTTTNGYSMDANGACGGLQQGKRALVAYDRSSSSGKRTALDMGYSGSVVDDFQLQQQPEGDYSNPQEMIKANQKDDQIMSAIHGKNSQVAQESRIKGPKYATDSSYCSIGVTDNDDEVGGMQESRSPSCEDDDGDLNLFTVFSYISDKSGNSKENRNRGNKQQARARLAENSFSRWSEGPFCTVMVRNNDQRPIARNLVGSINQGDGVRMAPGRAILKNPTAYRGAGGQADVVGVAAGRQSTDETRASCPDLVAAKAALGGDRQICGPQQQPQAKPKRQLSQPSDQPAKSDKALARTTKDRSLPRTISMIEYLGLNEFDLIASRHDKLLRRCRPYIGKRAARQQQLDSQQQQLQPCCYEPNSCPCCGGSRAQSRQTTGGMQQMRCPMQSDGDIAISSSEPLNSGDLVQTSSRLSCSTCCSLASRSYASQSELFDEEDGGGCGNDDADDGTTRSSQSVTSETITSSLSESYVAHNKHPSNSQLSSRSASILDQEAPQTSHYCQHGNQIYMEHHKNHLHHHHHHHPLNHQHNHPIELLSSATSSSSSSSSPFIVVNKQTKLPKTTENSLCISGVTYCSPASKEDANGAAQIMQPSDDTTTTSGEPNSMLAGESNSESSEQQRSFLSIKCDVLESL